MKIMKKGITDDSVTFSVDVIKKMSIKSENVFPMNS